MGKSTAAPARSRSKKPAASIGKNAVTKNTKTAGKTPPAPIAKGALGKTTASGRSTAMGTKARTAKPAA